MLAQGQNMRSCLQRMRTAFDNNDRQAFNTAYREAIGTGEQEPDVTAPRTPAHGPGGMASAGMAPEEEHNPAIHGAKPRPRPAAGTTGSTGPTGATGA